jgi:hypothetical protein
MNRKKYVYFDNDPYLASFAVNIDSKHIRKFEIVVSIGQLFSKL